jgi:hypothetical protein
VSSTSDNWLCALENALLRITKLKELKVAALEPPDSLIHEAISIAEHALKGEG